MYRLENRDTINFTPTNWNDKLLVINKHLVNVLIITYQLNYYEYFFVSLTLINPFKYENEKVNKFPKNIGLKNTFKNFLWKKKTYFFDRFFYFS